VIVGFDKWQHNGVLTMTPITRLTSPSASVEGITIQVFVSAGDDFEVAVPTDSKIATMSMFTPQFGDELVPQSGDVEDENALTPEEADATETILKQSQLGSTQDVFFGDPYVSFRTLIKRYMRADATRSLSYTTSTMHQVTYPHRPYSWGYDPYGMHADDASNPFNYVHNTFLTYVMSAYVAYRGSIRWKAHIGIDDGSNTFRVSMSPSAVDYPKFDRYNIQNNTSPSQYARAQSYADAGSTGMLATATGVNPVLEFEAPWYSNLRFSTPRSISPNDSRVSTKALWTAQERSHIYGFTDTSFSYLERYCAAGEDFMCGFFIGFPPVIFQSAPSASAAL
jgi:hypothetical protein